jgi:hypothetical protein
MPARVTEGALTENDALLLLRPRFEHVTDGKRLLRQGQGKAHKRLGLGRETKMRGVQRGEHEELVERTERTIRTADWYRDIKLPQS